MPLVDQQVTLLARLVLLIEAMAAVVVLAVALVAAES
jgi:hypothetical protein